jgi:hypothetical protein
MSPRDDMQASPISMTIDAANAEALRWDLYDAAKDGPRSMPYNYRGHRYPNWWGSGLSLSQLHELALGDGIPVAWVPPTDVLRQLGRAQDHQTRLDILITEQDAIRAQCTDVLAECDDEWLTEHVTIARKALSAWVDGHLEAAACLALLGAEDNIYFVSSVSRTERPKVRSPIAGERRLRLPYGTGGLKNMASGDLLFEWFPHEQILLAPLARLYTSYLPARKDPAPETLSRHAVVHRLSLEHLSPGHSIVAILLMMSMLREAEVSCEGIRADVTEDEVARES